MALLESHQREDDMQAFTKFTPESVARWLRHAQRSDTQVQGDMVCPRCGQSFDRPEVTETKGPSRYVGWMFKCPRCGVFSPARSFRYPKEETLEKPRGRGRHVYDPERILANMPLRTGPNGLESAITPASGRWSDDWSNRPTIGRSQP